MRWKRFTQNERNKKAVGVTWLMVKVHFAKGFAVYTVRSPNTFKPTSIRTQDIGRKGHSLRRAGRLKKTGKWATQAFKIKRSDYEAGLRVQKVGKVFKIVKPK